MSQPCPICGLGGATPAERGRLLALLRCNGCGVVYRGSISNGKDPVAEAHHEYFGEAYLRKRGVLSDSFHRRRARQRLRMIRRYKPAGRLLDIGCGVGDLLAEARKAGYDAIGLDSSPALAAEARRRHGVRVYCGDAAGFEAAEPFDIVVMSHVVEHVLEPLGLLRAVRRLLAPGAVLYVATPNVTCWEARFDGWAAYEPYHFVFFSPDTLAEALRRAGYRVLALETREPLSGWINTVVRGALGGRYEGLRLTVHHDARGVQRPRYFLARGLLGAARLGSGVFLTPVRRLQESLLRGEELVSLAVADAAQNAGECRSRAE